MANKVIKEKQREIQKNVGLNYITALFVLITGAVFPLYVRNYYFDILPAKYLFYWMSVLIMGVVLLAYGLVKGEQGVVGYLKKITVKDLWKSLSVPDKAVLLFWLISGISMITSQYPYEALWGNEGRFSGFFLMTMYTFSYFCVSSFWEFKNRTVDVILAVGILVCAFGITDYFQMDILHFKKNMDPGQVNMFTSTIGNINTYTAYAAIVMAVSTVLFTTSRTLVRSVVYYLCMVISFFAIIMGVSDNAYISMAALLGLLPLYLFSGKEGVRRYLVVIASLFTVIQCIDWINSAWPEAVLGIDSAFSIIIRYDGLLYVVLVLWLLVGGCYIFKKTGQKDKGEMGHLLQYIWLGFLAFVMCGILFVLYDCNVAGNAERYGGIADYIKFDDSWGTNRGYIWRNALECFMDFSWWQKLVGFGPDTFGIVLMEKTADNPYRQIFDSAHNEYLHYLITVGFVGAAAYVVFIGSWLVRVFRNVSGNPYVIAVAFGVICYAAQAVVNINLPIVAPVVWLFLAMGMAGVKKAKQFAGKV